MIVSREQSEDSLSFASVKNNAVSSASVTTYYRPPKTKKQHRLKLLIGFPSDFLLPNQGSGKGTLSARLVQQYDLEFVASGDVLRREIMNKTEVGRLAEEIVASGGEWRREQ